MSPLQRNSAIGSIIALNPTGSEYRHRTSITLDTIPPAREISFGRTGEERGSCLRRTWLRLSTSAIDLPRPQNPLSGGGCARLQVPVIKTSTIPHTIFRSQSAHCSPGHPCSCTIRVLIGMIALFALSQKITNCRLGQTAHRFQFEPRLNRIPSGY